MVLRKKSALEMAEENFVKTKQDPSVSDGIISINQMYKLLTNFEFSKREYQREKVATISFKQAIMETVLNGSFVRVPEIHVRVILLDNGENFCYELIDGQQRVTAVTDFLNNKYRFPKEMKVGDIDVGGFNATELSTTYVDIYQSILDYEISCKFYENLNEEQTAHIFVEVLNNVNDMKPQEIRNAISGVFSDWIRDTARGNPKIKVKGKELFPHKLFDSKIDTKTNKKTLNHMPNFKLKGRMELDEWVSELSYMYLNTWKLGVTQTAHTQWVKDLQTDTGKYSSNFTDKSKLLNLLNLSYNVITSVPTECKTKLTPMLSHILVLYANDLTNKYGKINSSIYTKKFFEIHDDWSCDKKKLYMNETTFNGKQMTAFKDLFGGRNKNAIGTICKILDKEFEKDNDSFGVVKLDLRKTFSKDDIYLKWKEQKMMDGYSNLPLSLEDAAGDHRIPRSAGIKEGGVTEYPNLVVTSKENNLRKGNMDSKTFKSQLNHESI